MAFIDPEDVAVDLGRTFDETETARVQVLILRAEAQLTAAARQAGTTLAALIEAGLDLTLIEQVESEMVCEVLRNPLGLRATAQTVGPFTESQTFDSATAAGQLQVTRRQLRLLGLGGGAFSINPAPAATPPAPMLPPTWWG